MGKYFALGLGSIIHTPGVGFESEGLDQSCPPGYCSGRLKAGPPSQGPKPDRLCPVRLVLSTLLQNAVLRCGTRSIISESWPPSVGVMHTSPVISFLDRPRRTPLGSRSPLKSLIEHGDQHPNAGALEDTPSQPLLRCDLLGTRDGVAIRCCIDPIERRCSPQASAGKEETSAVRTISHAPSEGEIPLPSHKPTLMYGVATSSGLRLTDAGRYLKRLFVDCRPSGLPPENLAMPRSVPLLYPSGGPPRHLGSAQMACTLPGGRHRRQQPVHIHVVRVND